MQVIVLKHEKLTRRWFSNVETCLPRQNAWITTCSQTIWKLIGLSCIGLDTLLTCGNLSTIVTCQRVDHHKIGVHRYFLANSNVQWATKLVKKHSIEYSCCSVPDRWHSVIINCMESVTSNSLWTRKLVKRVVQWHKYLLMLDWLTASSENSPECGAEKRPPHYPVRLLMLMY